MTLKREFEGSALKRLFMKTFLKNHRALYKAALLVRKLVDAVLRMLMCIFHGVCGIEKNKIYFSSFSGGMYNDSPKYICEALHEIYPEGKFVFRLNAYGMKQTDIPDYVIRVRQNSIRALKEMATARVIVKNAYFKPYMIKFADQYYVQTWHGDRGIKRIVMDAKPDRKKPFPDSKYMDLATSGSDFGRDICFRRAMRYTGEILDVGVAKNDILLAPPENIRETVCARLGIDPEKRILLYAPTFREKTSGSRQSANFSLRKLREALEEKENCIWQILVRSHALNTGVGSDEGMDVSRYPDVSELLLISDMLITDYSSIAYDYVLLNRPILHYHADRAQYTAESRKFLYDPEELPFIIAHNEEELIQIALNLPNIEENCRKICEFFGVRESGTATKQIAERIRKELP